MQFSRGDRQFCGFDDFLKLQGSGIGSERFFVGFWGISGGVL